MKCDQCEMLSINGMPCHERGCPNTNRRYDSDTQEWVRQITCRECGCTVDADSRGRYQCTCAVGGEDCGGEHCSGDAQC